MISGLVTQADVADALSLDCGAVVVGSGAGGATVAAELAEAGVDLAVIQTLLGHAHVDSSVGYIHLAPVRVRAASGTAITVVETLERSDRRSRSREQRDLGDRLEQAGTRPGR